MEKKQMIENKQINTILDKIHLFLAVFVLLWLNVGVATYISGYVPSYVKGAIYGLWLLLSIIAKKEYVKDLITITLPLIFFIIVIKLSSYFGDNSNLNMYLTNLLYIWIIASIAIYYIKDKTINKKLILTVLLIDIIYVGINTFVNLISNPLISRILSSSKETQTILLGDLKEFKAIGSYAYFYSLAIIILMLVDGIINNSDKIKIIYTITLIFLSILMIKAQFTICILLSIVFLIKIVLENKTRKRKEWHFLVFTILILLVLLLPTILNNIIEIEKIPHEIKIRLIEINKALQGNDISSTDLYSRTVLYRKSIDSFLENIIIGSWGENTVRRPFNFSRFIWFIWYICNIFNMVLY